MTIHVSNDEIFFLFLIHINILSTLYLVIFEDNLGLILIQHLKALIDGRIEDEEAHNKQCKSNSSIILLLDRCSAAEICWNCLVVWSRCDIVDHQIES